MVVSWQQEAEVLDGLKRVLWGAVIISVAFGCVFCSVLGFYIVMSEEPTPWWARLANFGVWLLLGIGFTYFSWQVGDAVRDDQARRLVKRLNDSGVYLIRSRNAGSEEVLPLSEFDQTTDMKAALGRAD
jgi:protein-S-isoprenylcysteine O-methyltransferase Ste14